ncbi:hypothetical protein Zmor_018454 [Zophobas morio]|uniref:Uncharacterized protein n=3 Tax=Zophobas morio TaxID=2755281 RepID=A0AA38IE13_9CUCU|nr:hypothetical protein Zmor_018454 [Zophobas morio]
MPVEYGFKAQTIIDEGRTTQDAINEIKKWLSETKFPEIPEEMIALFLLSCQNVIKDTQRTIKAYFKLKSGAPEMFTGRDINNEELQKASRVV